MVLPAEAQPVTRALTPPPVKDDRATLDAVLSSVAAEQEMAAAGHSIIAGAHADIVMGRNRAVQLAAHPNTSHAVILAMLQRSGPPIIASLASDMILAESSQQNYAEQLSAILKAPRPTQQAQPKSILKRLLGAP
jgi:hypothetical protein